MSIRSKALLALSGIMLSVLFLSCWALYMRHEYRAEAQLGAEGARRLSTFSDIKSAIMTMRLGQRGVLEFTAIHNQEKVNSANQQFTHGKQALLSAIGAAMGLATTPEDRQDLQDISYLADQYSLLHDQTNELCGKGKVENAIENDAQNRVSIRGGVSMHVAEWLISSADKQFERQATLNAKSMERVNRLSSQSMVVTILAVLLAVTTVVIVWVGVGGLVSSLTAATNNLLASTEQVSTAAGQISSGAQTLAQGSSQQAASIQETSESTQSILRLTKQNAEGSRNAAASVDRSRVSVADAETKLRELVTSMSAISMSSEKIAKITKLVDDVAFQTNLLALNAAVEAARAGEAGAGFAVVADEVRNLAQRSAQAARDTAQLLEESLANVTNGTQKLSAVEISVRAVVETAEETKRLVSDVTGASTRQQQSLAQISTALGEMENVTQQTAATAEQSAAAGEELRSQADSLKELVSSVHRLVSGKAVAV